MRLFIDSGVYGLFDKRSIRWLRRPITDKQDYTVLEQDDEETDWITLFVRVKE